MKIRKYQPGGEIQYLPTVDRIPGAQASGTSTSGRATSSGDKMSDLTKSVIDTIQSANGIDSDVTSFISLTRRMLALGSDPTGEGLTPNDVFKVQIYANKVKENAKYRDLAVNQLNQQDAWAEVAIDDRGLMYVSDSSGKISKINPSEFDRSKQVALTYKDLLSLRERMPGYAFNTSILMDVQNAVGMNAIMKTIDGIVKTFGTIQQSGYATKTDKEVAAGLAQLIGDGPNGVYKIADKHRYGADKHEIETAVNFILNSLPSGYKKSLNATAVAEGVDPVMLVAQMVQITANRSVEPFYQSMASKAAGIGGTTKAAKKEGITGSKTFTLAESYATGEGAGPTEDFEITPEGASVRMRVATRSMGNVKQKDGKQPIGKVNLQYLMENAYAISDLNLDGSVSFGDQPLTDAQKSAIMYDGWTMRRVVLPSKVVNGKIVPDFEIAAQLEKLTTALREQQDSMTPGQLQDILNERLPGARWDPIEKCVVWPHHHAFLTFRGYACSEYLDLNKDSKYLSKVSKERGKELQLEYEEVIKYGSLRHEAKAPEYVGHPELKGLFNRHADKDKFYEGNVFIALDASTVASAIYNGQEMRKDDYVDITEQAELRRDKMQMRTNF